MMDNTRKAYLLAGPTASGKSAIAAVLARCVRGPEGPESLDEIADGLWLICEESSWVLSAHNRDGDVYEGAVLPDPENPEMTVKLRMSWSP